MLVSDPETCGQSRKLIPHDTISLPAGNLSSAAPPDTRFEACTDPAGPDRQGIHAEAEDFGQLAAVVDLHSRASDVVARDDTTIQGIELLETLLETCEQRFPRAGSFRRVGG